MKNLLISIFVLFLFSCSTEDEDISTEEIPETYSVKYEIIGQGKVDMVTYKTNEGNAEVERDPGAELVDLGVTLPFVKEIVYHTEEAGENGSTGCDEISFSAYARKSIGTIESMNVYIDGELMSSESEGYYCIPDEHCTPWARVSFGYLQKGADPDIYQCPN
ncbi:hypothetical protein [Salegentibacter sp. UBA1130]|uniref:hypothetical protein n=1 Tax=Salegentibacter sp. UBA1130 TaxID=1947451 RepID=UPI00257CA5D1|nr:hypothetical protein [Salegentibacter sp. UBA1130]